MKMNMYLAFDTRGPARAVVPSVEELTSRLIDQLKLSHNLSNWTAGNGFSNYRFVVYYKLPCIKIFNLFMYQYIQFILYIATISS